MRIGFWLALTTSRTASSCSSKLSKHGYGCSAAVIYHAYKNHGIALIDEGSARTLARTLGILIRGTLGIMLESLKRTILSRQEALKALERLSEIMHLSADLYRIVRDEIDKNRA